MRYTPIGGGSPIPRVVRLDGRTQLWMIAMMAALVAAVYVLDIAR